MRRFVLLISLMALLSLALSVPARAVHHDSCLSVHARAIGQNLGGGRTEATIVHAGILNGTTSGQLEIIGGTPPVLNVIGTGVLTTHHGTLAVSIVGTFNAATGVFEATGQIVHVDRHLRRRHWNARVRRSRGSAQRPLHPNHHRNGLLRARLIGRHATECAPLSPSGLGHTDVPSRTYGSRVLMLGSFQRSFACSRSDFEDWAPSTAATNPAPGPYSRPNVTATTMSGLRVRPSSCSSSSQLSRAASPGPAGVVAV